MIEFSFRVVLRYRDPQAFNDESLERTHDRLNRRLFDAVAEEFDAKSGAVIVETEPAIFGATDRTMRKAAHLTMPNQITGVTDP